MLTPDITAEQQGILRKIYGTDDISNIPQMWAMYKEVMGYFANGLKVPDEGESGSYLFSADKSDALAR